MKTLLTLLALHLSTLLMAQEVNPFVKDPSAQQRWKSNYEKSSAFQEVLRLSRLEDSNHFFPYDMNQDGKIVMHFTSTIFIRCRNKQDTE